MSKVTDVTDTTFEDKVLTADKPTLVDFWAAWCAPCRMLSPILEQLADRYEGKINFVKIDTDANTKVAAEQGILSLPTVKVFQNGEVVKQFQGGRTKSALVKMLDELV